MEHADLAGDARLIHGSSCSAVPAGNSRIVHHGCRAISQECQQIGECFLNRQARPAVAAGLLQHFEGAAIVLHALFSGIHRMCGVAGLNERTDGAVGIGEAAGAIQMMGEP